MTKVAVASNGRITHEASGTKPNSSVLINKISMSSRLEYTRLPAMAYPPSDVSIKEVAASVSAPVYVWFHSSFPYASVLINQKSPK